MNKKYILVIIALMSIMLTGFTCIVLHNHSDQHASFNIAYGDVIPIAQCWENDIEDGGVIMYFGARSVGADPVEIPNGARNYMSNNLVPPIYFYPGFNGIMKSYRLHAPASITWHLSNSVVSLFSSTAGQQCAANAAQTLLIYFTATPDVLDSIDKPTATANLKATLAQYGAFPPASIGEISFESSSNGFRVSAIFNPHSSPSQFKALSLLISTSADLSRPELRNKLAQDVSPRCNVSSLIGPSTPQDVPGGPAPVPSPKPLVPVILTPEQSQYRPIIPVANCWERRTDGTYFYFGYNNTNSVVINVEKGDANFALIDSAQQVPSVTEVFVPGYSSLAFSAKLRPDLTDFASVTWYLLSHYVSMENKGVISECRSMDSVAIWMEFHGTTPTRQILDQVVSLIASTGQVDAQSISINVNGMSPAWRMEVSISQPTAAYRAGNILYDAYYNDPAFTSQLDSITGAQTQSLHVQPTVTDIIGRMRPIPTSPVIPTPTGKKLTAGQIVGIVFGFVVGFAIIGGIVFYARRKSGADDIYERYVQ